MTIAIEIVVIVTSPQYHSAGTITHPNPLATGDMEVNHHYLPSTINCSASFCPFQHGPKSPGVSVVS
jgi:hypothetical protein